MAGITLLGRLTRDPEMREVNGKTVCKFSVADVDKATRDRDAAANFFTCEIWGKGAEVVSNYFSKGQRILVQGKLVPNHWTNKDGNLVKDQLLKVAEFNFIESKNDSGSTRTQGGSSSQSFSEIPF